jgi:hypothetical protein
MLKPEEPSSKQFLERQYPTIEILYLSKSVMAKLVPIKTMNFREFSAFTQ